MFFINNCKTIGYILAYRSWGMTERTNLPEMIDDGVHPAEPRCDMGGNQTGKPRMDNTGRTGEGDQETPRAVVGGGHRLSCGFAAHGGDGPWCFCQAKAHCFQKREPTGIDWM